MYYEVISLVITGLGGSLKAELTVKDENNFVYTVKVPYGFILNKSNICDLVARSLNIKTSQVKISKLIRFPEEMV